jgi:hypothetical protein
MRIAWLAGAAVIALLMYLAGKGVIVK